MHKIPRTVGTHNGSFHADEVTACALLSLFDLVDVDKIYRTRDPELLARCEYVCDVGGIYDPKNRLFDHHQVDYQGSLSSAGMILLYLKNEGILDENDYTFLNHSLILGVDDHDNGMPPHLIGVCTYSQLIANFTPINHDCLPETQNSAFVEAFYFAKNHLSRLLNRHAYVKSCKNSVKAAMETGNVCLYFDQSIPWMESFFELDGINHPAKFIIMPSGKHWKLRGIPPSMEQNMQVRVPLPVEWAGLLEEDLKQVSGIRGAQFCHKGRFISVWQTKEDAIKALDYVLKKEGLDDDNF